MNECLEIVCTQVFGGVDGIVVDLCQHIINRENHERQEVVYHTQNDRPRGIDDGDIWQMEKGKNAIDDAIFLQKRLPREGTEQEIHPHRKDEDEYHKAACPNAAAAQYQCQRIGQEEADGSCGQGQSQR